MSMLKQDINLSKVDIEHIAEQGQQHIDLAQRLNVLVEGAATATGVGDEGTVLSLNRVQVMIAAAARQLVAGSKWITKETFDLRITEMRKEYLNGSRHVQTQIEAQLAELGGLLLKILPPNQLATIKLPKMLAGRPLTEQAPELISIVTGGKPTTPKGRQGVIPAEQGDRRNLTSLPLAQTPRKPITEAPRPPGGGLRATWGT
jgi:hypothetical protein